MIHIRSSVISFVRASLLIFCILPYTVTIAQSSQSFIESLDWKPDGSQLAIGYHDGVVEIVNSSGNLLKTFTFENATIHEVAWRPPDGSELAILTQNSLNILDPQSEIARTSETYMETISWSSNGMMLAGDGLGGDNPVYIIDIITLDTIKTLPGTSGDSVGPVVWHPLDNDIVAAGTIEGVLSVWSVSTGEVINSQRHLLGDGIIGLAWSQDASKLAVGYGGIIEILNAGNLELLARGGQAGSVRDMEWNNEGTLIASVSSDSLWITNALTGENVSLIDTGRSPGAVTWSPDGSTLAYGGADTTVQIVPAPQLITCNTTISPNNTVALVTAITNANTLGTAQTLCLEGTYPLTAAVPNTPSDGANGLPIITGNITLYGLGANRATITRSSGAPAFRIAKVDEDARLVLQNITLSNGSPGGSHKGGAIRNLGTLELIHATVTGNSSVDDGGGIFSWDNSTLIITDSIISNNTSNDGGGGVYSNTGSSTTITNSDFSNNAANTSSGLGGGLYMNGASLSITGGSFDTNNRARNGGAIYIGTVSGVNPAQINDVTLSNNTATHHGGAVYINAGSVIMDGVTIANNSATSIGGGIRNLATLEISNSLVQNNNGGSSSGGGIANAGTLTISNSQFLGNYGTGASFDGGALANTAIFTLNNSTLENNQAVDSGGAVYTSTATNNSLQHNCIVGNTAPNTSAVYSAVATLNAQYNWWGTANAPTNSQVNTNRVDSSNHNTVSCADALAGVGSALAALQSQAPTLATVNAPYENAMEDYIGWQTIGAWSQEALVGRMNGAWVADATIRDRVSSLEMNVAVNLGNQPNPRVRYWQRGTLASSDSVVLEILPQGATTWVALDQQSNLTSSWTQREIDLSAYRGETIRLRWILTTVGDVPAGQSSIDYAIDDFAITSRR